MIGLSDISENSKTEIKNEVINIINEKMPNAEAKLVTVKKNNGIILDGVSLTASGKTVVHCIYITGQLERGKSANEIADYIIRSYDKCKQDNISDLTPSFLRFEEAKKKLSLKIVNSKWNIDILEKVPKKEFLDLSIFIIVRLFEEEGNFATIKVDNALLKYWGKEFDEVYSLAYSNVMAEKTKLIPIMNLPMWILSNQTGFEGAVRILDEDAIREFSEKFESNVVAIPSSIHEFLLIPESLNDGYYKKLEAMLKDVNETVVDPEDILSDHPYLYVRGLGWRLPRE